ncbi:hypothetical protein D3C79_983350 [compost metagenome]
MVGFADAQIIEENLVEFVIVILSGMHQNMVRLRIQFGDDATHLDEFGTRANQRHDFKH